MASTLEIVICTESGSLENTSKLLLSTLRQYGGALANTPVVSYQPRRGFEISTSTKKFFEEYEVEYREIELNKDFVDYPLANKPLACAYHEQHSNADQILFLDSDVLILNEPRQFLQLDNDDIMLRPVGFKNIGSSGINDPHNAYWQKLYELFGINQTRYVTSINDQKRILEYYNTGHILAKREAGLFSQWAENFIKVSAAGIIPPASHFYLEQSVFGATVSQLQLKVQQFETPYNYPVQFLKNRKDLCHHPFYLTDFDQIISLHYHKIFEKPEGKDVLKNVISRSGKGKELIGLLQQHKVVPESKGLIGRILKMFGGQ